MTLFTTLIPDILMLVAVILLSGVAGALLLNWWIFRNWRPPGW